MRFVFILPFALFLSACETVLNPSYMPAGYQFHNEVSKSPHAPKARVLGYEYSSQKNDQVLQIWNTITADMVRQIPERFNVTPENIYIHSLPQANGFNNTYDNSLRESLTAQGYNVASYPSESLHLWYQAYLPEEKPPYKKDKAPIEIDLSEDSMMEIEDLRNFTFILTLVRDGQILGDIVNSYPAPSYGYIMRSSHYKNQDRLYKHILEEEHAPQGAL